MANFYEVFDPNSLEEHINLLPYRCRECTFARFLLALARFDMVTEPALEIIECIDESCSGYEGTDLTSKYYSYAFDRSGCPYVKILRQESGI
jgi:hypothetical protein